MKESNCIRLTAKLLLYLVTVVRRLETYPFVLILCVHISYQSVAMNICIFKNVFKQYKQEGIIWMLL